MQLADVSQNGHDQHSSESILNPYRSEDLRRILEDRTAEFNAEV